MRFLLFPLFLLFFTPATRGDKKPDPRALLKVHIIFRVGRVVRAIAQGV